jgi:hypothetical protein
MTVGPWEPKVLFGDHPAAPFRTISQLSRSPSYALVTKRELPVRDASGWTPAFQAGDRDETYLRVTKRGLSEILPGTLICGGLALYFLIEAFEPFSIFRLLLAVVTAFLTVRLFRSGTIIVAAGQVEWHTILRTRRWSYSDIGHFALGIRTGEPDAQGLRVLRMHMADGRAQWINGLTHGFGPDSGWVVVHFSQSQWPESRWSVPGRFWTHSERTDPDDVVAQLNLVIADVQNNKAVREAG